MSAKLITGILIGAGAALVIGYLVTDERSEIRKKIKKSCEGALDFLCDTLDKGKDFIKDKAAEAAGKADNIKEEVSGATQA